MLVASVVFVIILVVTVAGMMAYYSPNMRSQSDQINSQQSQIKNLQDQINQLSTKNSDLSIGDNTEISMLQNELSTANGINNLQDSTVWLNDFTVNQDRSAGMWYQYTASYAGYITATVLSSTTSNQYVQVTWTSNGIDYSNKITVGASGTAIFPVLPSSNVVVTFGNTNLLNGATATVSVTYTY